jgi:hypothetical protein
VNEIELLNRANVILPPVISLTVMDEHVTLSGPITDVEVIKWLIS